MKFIKENSYDIVKLLINQLGIAIFSMMLYLSVALIEDKGVKASMNILVSVLSTLFYFALLYAACWEFGAKDRIRIDGGKMKKSPFKGALLSLFANLINFLTVGIAIICKIIHAFGGDEAFNFVFAILNTFFRFILSMYLGAINGIFSYISDVDTSFLVQSIGYFVAPIISILVCQLGYWLGSREFRFWSLFSGNKKS